MDKNGIFKLEANPDTDALIAEKVMGLTISNKNLFDEPGIFVVYNTGNTIICHSPKKYTSNISAAWEVVEKLKSQGWSIDIQWDNWNELPDDPPVEYIWHVGLNYYTNDAKDFRSAVDEAETAPLAICRAALLAVMEDIDANTE